MMSKSSFGGQAQAPAQGQRAPLNYHRLLLDDPHRMVAYERAIRALVRPGDVVLDLGCGTGVLAMLAARAGAARVHAVESMPVARLAAELVRWNGLADRVLVREADVARLDPVEPVDLVVSDFLGRFLVDDGMLPAVAAAVRWLKPGGCFCPSRVRLFLAPVGGLLIESIDALRIPVFGLDLSPAVPYALNYCYHADLRPEWLLARPEPYCELLTTGGGVTFDHTLTFTLQRGGDLRGLGGWFEAEMAPGVVLATAPGVETHWGQYLFPLPDAAAQAGDELTVRLRLVGEETDPAWRWTGELRRSGAAVARFDLESIQRFGERGPAGARPPRPEDSHDSVIELNRRAGESFAAGRLDEAARLWEEAVWLLGPEQADIACALYENLGLAWFNLGRDGAAIRAFLRALDGELGRREQSLRFLAASCARAGRRGDALRYLEAYETVFGPHPFGLQRARL